MPTQAERRAATRRRILDAARSLLVERGAAGTTIAAVLDRAAVSRGALYHHFPSKEDLVAAVYEATSAEVVAGAARSVPPDTTPRDALVAGCLAWLRAVGRPATAAVLFDAGPAVLGWERCRAIEDATSLRIMRLSLQAVIDPRRADAPPVELAARVLDAALSELALAVVHGDGDGPPIGQAQVERTVVSLVDGLTGGQSG